MNNKNTEIILWFIAIAVVSVFLGFIIGSATGSLDGRFDELKEIEDRVKNYNLTEFEFVSKMHKIKNDANCDKKCLLYILYGIYDEEKK